MTPDPITQTGGQLAAPYLAVDVVPDDNTTGTFVLDVSELDGPDLLMWSTDDPGVWVNIVCDVTRVSYRRGASRIAGLLTQTEAGTCTVVLSDTRRAFDPMNNADVIHKGTPLRLRAWGYDGDGERWDAVLFTGEVDELAVAYQKAEAPLVTITGLDLVGALAAWSSEGEPLPGLGAGETLKQRAQRTLTAVGTGTLSPDSDADYAATLSPNVMAKPWQELSAAAEAELGRLWVDNAGRLVVRARSSALSGPVRGTLSDVHGETLAGVHCCASDASVVYGVEVMANRTLAARRLMTGEPSPGVLVRRDDEVSQARYGVGVVDRRSLELETDAQLGPWAEAVIVTHTRPELRVDSVTPSPAPDDLWSAVEAWPAVLQTDLGDRWRFLFRPTVGPAVDRTLGVLGIELLATPEQWSVTWATTDATGSGWFVLDVSELDGGDLLAPFSIPA